MNEFFKRVPDLIAPVPPLPAPESDSESPVWSVENYIQVTLKWRKMTYMFKAGLQFAGKCVVVRGMPMNPNNFKVFSDWIALLSCQTLCQFLELPEFYSDSWYGARHHFEGYAASFARHSGGIKDQASFQRTRVPQAFVVQSWMPTQLHFMLSCPRLPNLQSQPIRSWTRHLI